MSRQNNINLHTQDYASQVLVDKQRLTNQLKVNQVQNLQNILDLLGETALKQYQLPVQNDRQAGIVRSATQAEVDAGTASNIYVSPLTLKNQITKPEATETVKGIARFSTNNDVTNEQETRSIVNPKTLHHVLTTRRATEQKVGTTILSTKTQAETGTDDTSAMTPLKVKQAIAKFTPKVEFQTAQETTQGYTRLATRNQTQSGTLDIGYAVSPKAFVQSRASTTQVGTTKLATAQETLAQTATDIAVTPAGLKQLLTSTGTLDKPGFVKLTTNVNQTDVGAALSPLAKVVPQTRKVNNKPLDRDITITSGDVDAYSKWEQDRRYLGQGVPPGTIIAFAGQNAPHGYLLCHGQNVNKHHYPNLFAAIGYTYGGGGDGFNLPDLRGEFIRGFDSGRGTDRNRAFGSWQKATLGVANGADYTGQTSHGMALGPNFSGQGRWEWERPGERCRNGIYHCRNHPPRWIGPRNISDEYTAYQAAEIFGGDVVNDSDVGGIWHQWASGGGNGNAVGTIPNERKIGQGHIIFGQRPRNIAMHYIIKV